MNNKVEILAPAGDLKRGMIALAFGADAIYFGAKAYSLRARASNFDFTDVKQMCTYAHKLGKRAYLVTNILCHCHHLPQFSTFLTNIIFADVDGYICSDPFIIQTIKEKLPQKEIHISTQLSVTNSKAALFYKNNGATRIIVSRELAINELKEMIANVQNQIAIEYFVHGAVCIACSGRCMLSSNYCLRDANVGGCAQSCR
jgi:putative protease